MRTPAWLLLAAGAFAVAEIWLIVLISGRIGALWTLFLLLAGAVLGGWLLKLEWPRAWRALFEAGDEPAEIGARLTDAALVFVGAALLMLPGFISDLIGLLFILPPTRALSRRLAIVVIAAFTRDARAQVVIMDARLRTDTVVEGEVVDEPDPTKRPGDDGETISGEILP